MSGKLQLPMMKMGGFHSLALSYINPGITICIMLQLDNNNLVIDGNYMFLKAHNWEFNIYMSQ